MDIKGKRLLVIGGAGLIGSHIVDMLLERGDEVTIIDNLIPEIHPSRKKPPWIRKEAKYFQASVCDGDILHQAMKDIDIVYHLAAYGGFEATSYKHSWNNCIGASVLADCLSLSFSMGKT